MNNVNLLYEVAYLEQSEGLGIVRNRNRERPEWGRLSYGKAKSRPH